MSNIGMDYVTAAVAALSQCSSIPYLLDSFGIIQLVSRFTAAVIAIGHELSNEVII